MLNTEDKIEKLKILCISAFFFAFFCMMPTGTRAAGATLYLVPGSGTFFVGSTFDVSVFVNTGGENVNAVEVNLKFDPAKIQIVSSAVGQSFVQVWISQPSFSNRDGTITFIGGLPTPGVNASAGLISTITFRVMAPGQTVVSFLDNCKVLKNDSKGTNILTSKNRGVYTLSVPPPEGPIIYSTTHPDQNKWYKDNNPNFYWQKDEGVTDFSYSFDQDPLSTPDNNSEGGHSSVGYSDVKDGVWYFHVKTKKDEVWGGTSHYSVSIDNTPPAAFTPTVEPSVNTSEKQPLISFITTDALSGLSYYRLRYVDITSAEQEELASLFTEVSSPHRLPALKIGKYLVIVVAYDAAGNFREGTVKLTIYPKGITFSRDGLQFKQFLFPWWILLLILLIVVILIIFRAWQRYQKLAKRKNQELDGMERKLEMERRMMARLKEEAEEREAAEMTIKKEKERQMERELQRESTLKETPFSPPSSSDEEKADKFSERKKTLEAEKNRLRAVISELEKNLNQTVAEEKQIESEIE